jgi:hypothetical protein
MALSLATVGAKITAAFMNLIVAEVNKQGHTAIIPTSVAGTGVTVGASGKVSFTASTSISLNGIFTSTYDHYKVEIYTTAASTAVLRVVLRSAGTDATAANYDYTLLYANSATPGSATVAANANWTLNASISSTVMKHNLELTNPFLASMTTAIGRSVAYASAVAPLIGNFGGGHRLSTSYDGLTFTTSTGSLTGTIRVYGYNNN